ncbi:MAG: hypothetical protein Q4C71_03765 [Microbacteriaceae bacterium]|nr:hypothetical protein [Microbacteriaceae bacterium]
MKPFINAVRAEITKLMSLRTTIVYVILFWLLVPTFMLLGYFAFATTKNPTFTIDFENLMRFVSLLTVIAVSQLGNTGAANISHGMTAHAFLTQDRRSLWLKANLLVNLSFAFGLSVLSILTCIGLGAVLPRASLQLDDTYHIPSAVLTLLFYGIFAYVVGIVLRNRTAAVVVPLACVMVVSPILTLFSRMVPTFNWITYFDPATMIDQIKDVLTPNAKYGMPTTGLPSVGFGGGDLRPVWFNVTVLIVMIVAMLVFAFWANSRRDAKQSNG